MKVHGAKDRNTVTFLEGKHVENTGGSDYMETIEQQAKLTEKHEMIIKQQTTPAKDLVES